MWGLQRDDQRGPACRDREAVSNVGDELGLNLGYDSFSPLSRLSPWGGISLGETKQGMGGQVAGNMSMTFLKYAQAAAIAKQGGLSGVSTQSSQAGPGIGMLSQHLGLPQSVAFEASHRRQLMSGHSGNHRPETSPQLNPLVNNAQVIFQPKPLIARIGSQVRQQALGLPGRHAPDLMHHHDTSVYGSMTSMGLGMDRSGDGLCIPDKNVLVQGAPSMLMPGASRKDFDDIWGTSGVVHAPLIAPLVAQSRMISARQQNVAPPPPEKLLRAEEIHEIVELLHEYRDQSEHAIYTRLLDEVSRMRAELSKAQARLMMVLEMGDRLEANPDARPPHESEVENGKLVQPRYWNQDEHVRFMAAIQIFGNKDLKTVTVLVGSRTLSQVRTHLRKFHQKNNQGRVASAGGDSPQRKKKRKRRGINGSSSSDS